MSKYLKNQIEILNPKFSYKTSNFSWGIYATVCLLLILGLCNLYSAGVNPYYFRNQIKYLFLTVIICFLLLKFISIRTLNSFSFVIHFLCLLSLILVLFLGYSAGGAKRWLAFGSFRIQPSEFVKISLILSIAKFFYNSKAKKEYNLIEIWPTILNILFVFVVIFLQPDFGTAGLCLIIALGQLAFVNISVSKKVVFFILIFSVASAFFGWTFFLHKYQKLRILNLFNPQFDPSGSGYNSLQSLVAVGSGGFFGKGFLHGTQTQLHFLPAKHTDFVFSVFSEEHGLLGGGLIFLLFSVLSMIGLAIARESDDVYKRLVAVGVVVFIYSEFMINVSMVMGMFPVVGMPLPFFSYGGSSLLTVSLGLTLLLIIDKSNSSNLQNSILRS